MKKGNKKVKKSPEELKFENDFRKAKLQLEKGAIIKGNSNIPPEIESMFLDHIEKFDKAYKTAGLISVFEKIGCPVIKSFEVISDKSIKKELNSLLRKMMKKGIIVESICEISDREMYRFITKELFKHEINNIPIKGMMTHFTYEEFHPNHAYDIKRTVEDFIKTLLQNKEIPEHYFLGKELKTGTRKKLTEKEAIDKFNFIRSFYSEFELTKFAFTGWEINKKNTGAKIFFDIAYQATFEGSREKQSFNDRGFAHLKKEWDFWTISKINIPGIKI